MKYNWSNLANVSSRRYKCGHCGSDVSSEKGYLTNGVVGNGKHGWIYICHHCTKPTFFDVFDNQFPGQAFGQPVEDISDPLVLELYEESRRCIGASAYTACVLACRKLLMHMAVTKGADENKNFAFYVDYLAKQGFVPPGAQSWVDHIRKRGNEATHEIELMTREDAEDLVSFSEMLLKIIFEFPAKVAQKYSKPNG